MADLVLSTRLAMLRSNLEQVAGILTDAERRSAEISKLRDHMIAKGGIEDSLLAIQRGLRIGVAHLDPLARKAEGLGPVLDQLNSTLTEIESTISRIDQCRHLLDSFLERRVQIGGGKVERTLRDRLVDQATRKILEVDRIQSSLRSSGENGSQELRTAWADYRQKLQNHSEPLFGEYVDVLRGLALRETGLDEGICRIADMLLEQFGHVGRVHWESLTIPARRAAMEMTVAQLIRLGFPEWTLWALPLAAYEFGHVVVSEHPELSSYRQSQTETKEDRRHLETCLADAYATYSMGPAYACAAVLLRFDPGDSADVERAEVILGMIERTETQAQRASYQEILEVLRREWSAAVEQSPAGPVSASDRQRLEGWIDFFVDFFQTNAYRATYRDEAWALALTWAEELDSVEPEVEEIPQVADLRDVLNAAWLCRVRRPEATDRILKNAKGLWARLSKRPGGGPSRPPFTPVPGKTA